MKINRFNESNDDLKLCFKKYKCDKNGIEILNDDIKWLIETKNTVYDLYHNEGVLWDFVIYVEITNIPEEFIKIHNFVISKLYKNITEIRDAISVSGFKKINIEDVDSIYYSTISNKFNI